MANSPSLPLITQAASVFIEYPLSSSELNALSLMVDQGVKTLPQAFIDLSQSSQRSLGATDELARLFFILFGRAPDLATYSLAMKLMVSGQYTLTDICRIGLQLNTSLVSDSLNLNNSQFVSKLSKLMFSSPSSIPGVADAIQSIIYQLDNQLISRAQLLCNLLSFDDDKLLYHYEIDPALDYLAATGQPPSQAQLNAMQGVPELILLSQVMASYGVAPYGTYPYMSETSNVLKISGNFASSFSVDLLQNTSSLGNNANYRLFLTDDGGITVRSTLFTPSILSGIQKVDASGLGTSVTSFTFTAGNMGSNVIAPNVPSVLTGGSGQDTLTAGNATTTLIAGSGNETLIGGSGTNTFKAGPGQTVMTAGTGADTFILSSMNSFSQFEAFVTINGFGTGKDVLDLSILSGNTGTAKPATAIIGSSDLSNGFINMGGAVNNSVFLVNDTGQWVNYSNINFSPRTVIDIQNLFFTTPNPKGVVGPDGLGPVVFTKAPLLPSVYFVIDYNAYNGGADIWYVNNLAPLTTITSNEITLVGHFNPTGNLWQALTNTGSIVL